MTPDVTPYENQDPGTMTLPGVNSGGSSPLLNSLVDNVSGIGGFSLDNILGVLNTVWLIYAILAYIFCIFLLVLYVYASTGKKQLEDLDHAHHPCP